jgi:hypothetical protein
MCQTQASMAMNVSMSDVDVRRGPNVNDKSENYVLLWDARLNNGRHEKGYCEADSGRGQIVRFERNEYQGSSGGSGSQEDAERTCKNEASRRIRVESRDLGTDGLRNADNGNYRIKWYTDISYENNSSGLCEIDRRGNLVRFEQDGVSGGGPVGDYARVEADTDGTGTFDGGNLNNARIERGYIDTRGDRPTIALRGRNFRITFYGEVDSTTSKREFTIRITGSDRGNARGRAQIRLNTDLNEVEMIKVDGRLNRDEFSGNFNRNR